MVIDSNHELFSHVGIIGRRTQVIQVVSSLIQIILFRTTNTNIYLFITIKKNNEMYKWLVFFTLISGDGLHKTRQEWMREDQLVATFPDK